MLSQACNLLSIIGVLLFSNILPSTLVVTPLFFKVFFRVFMRRTVNSECSSFSELVRPTQLRCIVAATKFVTVLFIALKVDSQLNIAWVTVFWSCWVFEAFLIVISTGVFLLFTGSICTWAVNEAETVEVVACGWLFYSVGGATACFAIVLTETIALLESIDAGDVGVVFSPRMFFVQGFLFFFILMTVCNQASIA